NTDTPAAEAEHRPAAWAPGPAPAVWGPSPSLPARAPHRRSARRRARGTRAPGRKLGIGSWAGALSTVCANAKRLAPREVSHRLKTPVHMPLREPADTG